MKFARQLLIAASATCAFAAQAGTVNLGTLASGSTVSQGSASFAAGASIDDLWNFTLSDPLSSVEVKLNQVFFSPSNAISSFDATLSGGTLSSPVSIPTVTNTSNTQVLDLISNLGSGDYTLTVTGLAQYPAGSYSVQISPTAVPEPEVYGMLLAGFGVMGLVAARRRSV